MSKVSKFPTRTLLHPNDPTSVEVEDWRYQLFPFTRKTKGDHSCYYSEISRDTVLAEIECTRNPDKMVQTPGKHRKLEVWG